MTMIDDTDLTPAACWAMVRRMPNLCGAREFAGAVLHGVFKGWIPPGDLSDGGPAVDGASANAVEQVATRRAFINLIHSQVTPDDAPQVAAAVCVAPYKWRVFAATRHFVRTKLLQPDAKLSPGQATALTDLCGL